MSQNGWNASASADGVPGVSADWRPSENPAKNRALPARTVTRARAPTRTPARLAAAARGGSAGTTGGGIGASAGEVWSSAAAGPWTASETSAVGSSDGGGGDCVM